MQPATQLQVDARRKCSDSGRAGPLERGSSQEIPEEARAVSRGECDPRTAVGFGDGGFLVVTAFWSIGMAVSYSKLWQEGFNWRDVFQAAA